MEMMTPQQRAAHTVRVQECLQNRRASVATELDERRAAVERGIRDRGRDPVFSRPELIERNRTRVAELERELREVDSRIAAGV